MWKVSPFLLKTINKSDEGALRVIKTILTPVKGDEEMFENIELRYGDTVQRIRIPRRNLVCSARSRKIPFITCEEAKIAEAIDHPIGSSTIEEIISSNQKIAIIVDDVSRPTPIPKILPVLLKRLKRIGVKNEHTVLVMATGAHERPPQEQIERKIGQEIMKKLNVQIHDCLNKNDLTFMGFSSFGTPIWINRLVAEADVKIGVGGVKPHAWAGFGGGAKIVLPGVSSWEAIGRNHTLAISSESRMGNIDGNSFRKDVEEVARKVDLNMIINTVLNNEGKIVDVVAGNFVEAHRKCVETDRKLFEYTVKDKVDILILGFGPMDETLWGVLMGKFVGIKKILKEGGTIILVAACPKGIYRYGEGHLDYSGKIADYSKVIGLLKSGRSPEEMLSEAVIGNMPYPEVGVKAHLFAKLAKGKNVIIVTQNLKKEEVSWLGKTSNTAQEALHQALQTNGKDAKVGIIPDFGRSNAYIRKA